MLTRLKTEEKVEINSISLEKRKRINFVTIYDSKTEIWNLFSLENKYLNYKGCFTENGFVKTNESFKGILLSTMLINLFGQEEIQTRLMTDQIEIDKKKAAAKAKGFKEPVFNEFITYLKTLEEASESISNGIGISCESNIDDAIIDFEEQAENLESQEASPLEKEVSLEAVSVS